MLGNVGIDAGIAVEGAGIAGVELGPRLRARRPLGAAPSRTGVSRHCVEFYGDDACLERGILADLGAGVANGEAVIAIARPARLDALRRLVRRAGADVGEASRAGRLALLDAAHAASLVMVDGQPDRAAFDEVAGTLVRRAAASSSRVRAYGEVEALLWQRGQEVAALELEALWNRLAEEATFSLHCAYPLELMERPDFSAAFERICVLHSETLPEVPVMAEAERLRRFASSASGPGQARRFVAGVLLEWGRADLLDEGLLIVTELATNVVTHARSLFSVSLQRVGSTVKLAVGDTSPTAPAVCVSDVTARRGRGLQIVRALAADWGHLPMPGGKLVWADLAGSTR